MPRPPMSGPPIGMLLSRVAKTVSRAFDDALAEAGGSRPAWLILIALKSGEAGANQRRLAEAVGIQGATLTHHLNSMEAEGLVTRRRDPGNRRSHVVELTEAGESAFHRMRSAAVSFDRRLREGLSDEDLKGLERVLVQMRDNVAG
ncbi:MarR family winged helix-turn-helix transcriptional regulator [Streptomyces sp. NPDC005408]|uniref:MarR family winged helix-turn-helix transcriptional regulator n=1 Tax=Streptomyces sp. NPDC005408 TaxID=3155341 RepID=UPI0033AAE732